MGAYGPARPRPSCRRAPSSRRTTTAATARCSSAGSQIDDGMLFQAAAIGGAILVVAGSIGNVLLTVLINLLNELTGGLRHTIVGNRWPASRCHRFAPPGRRSDKLRRSRPGL